MKEVNNLLNRLGELDNAPLIWVNKKVYDMAEEIERLNNDIKELLKENGNKEKVIKAQDNIIKEVREYIEENQEEHKYTDRGGFTYTEGHFLRDSDTLLEILDKENI